MRRTSGYQMESVRLMYYAWRVVAAIVWRLPLRVSYSIAAFAGSAAFVGWRRGRRATLRNYHRMFPQLSPKEVRRLARMSLVNYCKYLVDFVRFPRENRDSLRAAVVGDESYARLEKSIEECGGAIVVCMHFGNWDLGAGATAARGYPVTVIAETFADARLDRMVVGARQKLGMRVVKLDRVAPSILRTLKQKGVLALLLDRPVPGDGVRVEFFGRSVEVPAGPARLALRSGAAVIPAAFARKHPWKADVTALTDFSIVPMRTGDHEADVVLLTQSIMTAHERFIRAYPDQWYMFRDMWPGNVDAGEGA